MENQTAVFHASHRPLEISQKRRDFHISTASACAGWKSGKPKTGFPLFHAAQADDDDGSSLENQNRRKEVGRYAASSFLLFCTRRQARFHAHPSIRKCWGAGVTRDEGSQSSRDG